MNQYQRSNQISYQKLDFSLIFDSIPTETEYNGKLPQLSLFEDEKFVSEYINRQHNTDSQLNIAQSANHSFNFKKNEAARVCETLVNNSQIICSKLHKSQLQRSSQLKTQFSQSSQIPKTQFLKPIITQKKQIKLEPRFGTPLRAVVKTIIREKCVE
ncbi:Hypothetical_protein [Hexamita inflata]|uniref:Hypothetical_protein n=1 Tax=Hexamita inflata TaxID=28002 RepID=A0AA86R9K1_9EUKA|nr:Hypothetical protein HINF_LOCUS56393 [Hexamita inflata]